MQKLYTIKEVHEQLGLAANGKELTLAGLEELVVESRCYRRIGSVVRLTEGDVLAFLTWCSPRRAEGGEPSDTEPGLIVVIGSPLERDGLVYVTWTQRGMELDVLERVQEGCPEKIMVLGAWDAIAYDYRDMARRWRTEKKHYRGRWFKADVRAELAEKLDQQVENDE